MWSLLQPLRSHLRSCSNRDENQHTHTHTHYKAGVSDAQLKCKAIECGLYYSPYARAGRGRDLNAPQHLGSSFPGRFRERCGRAIRARACARASLAPAAPHTRLRNKSRRHTCSNSSARQIAELFCCSFFSCITLLLGGNIVFSAAYSSKCKIELPKEVNSSMHKFPSSGATEHIVGYC